MRMGFDNIRATTPPTLMISVSQAAQIRTRGHVELRHAMRMMLQSSAVGLVLAWYVGDVSSLFVTVPAIIMQAKYSRDMEREADV